MINLKIPTSSFNPNYLLVSILAAPLLLSPAQANSDYVFELNVASQHKIDQNAFAMVPFAGDSLMSSVISNNLNSTELQLTDKYSPELAYSSEQVIQNLAQWRQLGVPYVVVGQTASSSGAVIVDYEVIDLVNGKVLKGKQSTMTSANPESMRRAAHRISDNIYEIITGIKGDFSDRIAYVEEKGKNNNKVSSLKIMDADRQNARTLFTRAGSIFAPTWSPDGQNVAFSHQLPNGLPVIYIQNIHNSEPVLVTPYKGNNLSPSFSPDGNNLIFSSSFEGNADIYRLNLRSNSLEKLISMPSIDTEPSYAPDGRSFVFVSNRDSKNSPQIYRYTFSSGRIDRITSGGQKQSPAISPDGSKIAFLNGGAAAIMNANGGNIQNIATTGKFEAPRFSSNGTRVVYSSIHKGKGVITIHSLNGGKKLKSSANGIIHSPVWSNTTN